MKRLAVALGLVYVLGVPAGGQIQPPVTPFVIGMVVGDNEGAADPVSLATNAALTDTFAQTATITNSYLNATGTAPITYTVTSGPTDGEFRVGGVAVTTWTQAQVTAGSLSYVHAGTAPGDTTDSATFTVANAANSIAGNTFNIAVKRPFYGTLFDGTNDLILIGNVADLRFDTSSAFSVAAWVQTNATSGHIITKYTDSHSKGWGVGVGSEFGASNGRIGMSIQNYIAGVDYRIRVDGPTDIRSATLWQHLGWTYDGSKTAAGVALYVNGSSETENVSEDDLTGTIVATTPARVGTRGDGYQPFNGSLAQLRVYNRVLSAAEVAEDRLSIVPLSGCVLWYSMQPGTGQSVTDQTGRGNTGTFGTDGTVEATDPAWAGYYTKVTAGGPGN